jgi:hypothetical protein
LSLALVFVFFVFFIFILWRSVTHGLIGVQPQPFLALHRLCPWRSAAVALYCAASLVVSVPPLNLALGTRLAGHSHGRLLQRSLAIAVLWRSATPSLSLFHDCSASTVPRHSGTQPFWSSVTWVFQPLQRSAALALGAHRHSTNSCARTLSPSAALPLRILRR